MMPVIAHTALESLTILTNMSRAFAEFCVTGIEANRDRARDLMERSSALSTPLAPYLGYALAADIPSRRSARAGPSARSSSSAASSRPRSWTSFWPLTS